MTNNPNRNPRLGYLASAAQLKKFAAEHSRSKQAPRHTPAFAKAVRAAKTDTIYNAHTYHTKVPPAGIVQYIEHYTETGHVVLDPFCGSGMTGVAAGLCGRHALLLDLAPAACHIAWNHNHPFDPADLAAAWRRIRSRVSRQIGRLYETVDGAGKPAVLDYTVWSDVYACGKCGAEIVLWDAAADRAAGRVAMQFPCPACKTLWKKTSLKLIGTRPVQKRVRNKSLPVTDLDLEKIREADALPIPCWYPQNRMMNAPDNVVVWGDKWRKGCFSITHVSGVYTHRNLWALALIWDEIGKVRSTELRAALQFLFTSIARRDSRRTAWNGARGSSISGTLYISSISVENNVLKLMDDKLPKLIRAFAGVARTGGSQCLVHNGSATHLPLPDESIDYVFTDPPFGGSLQYAELNFIWEAWLQQFTPVENEAIMTNTQKKGVNEYRRLMCQAFREIRRVLKPGRWASVVFHSTSDTVWNAIQQAAVDAEFDIVKAVPFDKVQKTYNQAKNTKAAGYDVVMNLHKSARSAVRKKLLTGENIDEVVTGEIRRCLAEQPLLSSSPQYLHSMAISALLNRGIAVEKVTIPYIIELSKRIE